MRPHFASIDQLVRQELKFFCGIRLENHNKENNIDYVQKKPF